MRFLIDMPLSPVLARWPTSQGHDAIHAIDVKLDSALVELAKREGRTLVTADLDFPRLLTLAQATEPSLILFRHGNWSEAEVVARMSDVLASLSETNIVQSILVVDHDRVRRRRLPIS